MFFGACWCDRCLIKPHCPCVQIQRAGRTPIPPPLRARFAAIEQQRAEEAALGERGLEEVVAPVPVPQDIAQDMAKVPNAPPYPPPHADAGVDPMDLIAASRAGLHATGAACLEFGVSFVCLGCR